MYGVNGNTDDFLNGLPVCNARGIVEFCVVLRPTVVYLAIFDCPKEVLMIFPPIVIPEIEVLLNNVNSHQPFRFSRFSAERHFRLGRF